ncbi:MAG: hypothetical protein A2091_07305 [Desulfuromonadales bacterium GWD2_61_12]|nr:MAG: hypothetical protein A2091_07305 [Desulfuromonadales bacterium GWD2_61_12]
MTTLWLPPPPQLSLSPDEIHLWRAPLPLTDGDPHLLALLSADERERAARLRIAVKRQQFVAGRVLLRQLLGRYLGADPQTLTFAYGPHGKPRLAAGSLAFNLAHAGAWALVAVTLKREVGVDLEQADPHLDYERLAAQFFTVEEQRQLATFPVARRRRGFYRLWTRKEARLKGEGRGFSRPDASVAEEAWQLHSFPVARGYLGALAVAGNIESVRRWDFVAE